MTKGSPVCLITGVGPGTGSALVKRFVDAGYDVAMLARNASRLESLASCLASAHAFVCDVSDAQSLHKTIGEVRAKLGDPSVVIHNAVGGAFGDFLQVEPDVLEQNFRVNTLALLHLAQALLPPMIAAGRGSLIATGNTSAYRGKAQFAAFAPSKAAQRVLLESIARSAGPKGVHVAYVAIDAVIDVPWTRARFTDKPADFFIKPADIADECFHIAHQPRSAWAFDVTIRPFGEDW